MYVFFIFFIALLSVDRPIDEIAKDRSRWQYPDVHFGIDLATEHERWLAEEKFKTCTFV